MRLPRLEDMRAFTVIWVLGTGMTRFAPAVQRRVFASRRLLGQVSAPVALLIAGRLADGVFEPAMQPGGAPALVFALMMLVFGFLGVFTGILPYFFPAVRDVELPLRDHEQAASTSADAMPEIRPAT